MTPTQDDLIPFLDTVLGCLNALAYSVGIWLLAAAALWGVLG